MRIFKEIKIKDRLPDKEGTYTFASLSGIKQRHWIGDAGDLQFAKTQKYWYEPDELPDETYIIIDFNTEPPY